MRRTRTQRRASDLNIWPLDGRAILVPRIIYYFRKLKTMGRKKRKAVDPAAAAAAAGGVAPPLLPPGGPPGYGLTTARGPSPVPPAAAAATTATGATRRQAVQEQWHLWQQQVVNRRGGALPSEEVPSRQVLPLRRGVRSIYQVPSDVRQRLRSSPTVSGIWHSGEAIRLLYPHWRSGPKLGTGQDSRCRH